ncbi:MAG: class I SAM-dependent methyltransferase [Gammaproteobacteria bacterium]|nr:class I SAM-dependent methyltransferase [Gammaproteobacteria bacterium]
MNTTSTPQAIIDREHHTWRSVSEGWRKNDAQLRENASGITQRMLDLANIGSGHRVLDIASGTGEPAIPAAHRVGPTGRVIGVDLVDEMLVIAREKAQAQALHNVEFQTVDGRRLDFDAASFDAVTCRWGLMFMPEPQTVLQQIHPLLKDDGQLVVSCWAEPERNPFFTHAMSILVRHMAVPQPAPKAPGVFAFADREHLQQTLHASGFRDVTIEDLSFNMIQVSSGEAYWQLMQELAGPIAVLTQQMDPATYAAFSAEVIASAEALKQGDTLNMVGTTWIARAQK